MAEKTVVELDYSTSLFLYDCLKLLHLHYCRHCPLYDVYAASGIDYVAAPRPLFAALYKQMIKMREA